MSRTSVIWERITSFCRVKDNRVLVLVRTIVRYEILSIVWVNAHEYVGFKSMVRFQRFWNEFHRSDKCFFKLNPCSIQYLVCITWIGWVYVTQNWIFILINNSVCMVRLTDCSEESGVADRRDADEGLPVLTMPKCCHFYIVSDFQ